jgi:hypothetical protein
MTLPTSERRQTSEDEVLGLIVDHLRTKLNLGESHCQEVISPDVKWLPPGGDVWIGVSSDGSVFDDGTQFGGGRNTLWEMLEFTVTGYSRARLDRTNTDKALIHDAKRGLTVLKQRILSAMVAADLSAELSSVLLQPPLAVSTGPVNLDPDAMVGWKSIRFRVGFSNVLATEGDRV